MDMLLVQDFSGEWFVKNQDDRFVDVHGFKKPILFQNKLFQKTNINSANFNLLLVSNRIIIGCVIQQVYETCVIGFVDCELKITQY